MSYSELHVLVASSPGLELNVPCAVAQPAAGLLLAHPYREMRYDAVTGS